jgi:uracil-DNA glycosylase
MEETFDPEALTKLIDQALSDEVPVSQGHLSSYEGRLLERLATVLPRHLGQQATRSVLRELRDEGLDGHRLDLTGLQRAIAGCTRCPGLRPTPQPTLGNLDNPDLLVVAEMLPGLDAAAIWRELELAGITRHRAAITGATRCAGDPHAEDIERCTEHLISEIEVLRPQLIMTVGSIPTQVLLGPTKITEARGKLWWIGLWPILPTYSLAYASRGGRAEEEMRVDFGLARRFLDG